MSSSSNSVNGVDRTGDREQQNGSGNERTSKWNGVFSGVVRWVGLGLIILLVAVIAFLAGIYRHSSVRPEQAFPEQTSLFVSVHRLPQLLEQYRGLPEGRKESLRNVVEYWGLDGVRSEFRERGISVGELLANDLAMGLVRTSSTSKNGPSQYRPILSGHLSLAARVYLMTNSPWNEMKEVRGVNLFEFSPPGARSWFVALEGNYFVLAPEKTMAAAGMKRVTEDGSSILDTDHYTELRGKLGPFQTGNSGYVFVRPDGLWNHLRNTFDAADPLTRLVRKGAPDLFRTQNLLGELSLRDRSIEVSGVGQLKQNNLVEKERRNMEEGFRRRGFFLPEKTMFHRRVAVPPTAYYRLLKSGGSPEEKEQIRQEVETMNELLGDMDFEEEFIPSLGPGLVYGLTVPGSASGNERISEKVPPNFFAMLEIRKSRVRKKLNHLIQEWFRRVRERAREMQSRREGISTMHVEERRVENKTIYAIVEESQEKPDGVSGYRPGYTFVGSYFVVAMNRDVLYDLVRNGGEQMEAIGEVPDVYHTGLVLRVNRLFEMLSIYEDSIASTIVRQRQRRMVADRVEERKRKRITTKWKRRKKRQIRKILLREGLEPETEAFERQMTSMMESEIYRVESKLYDEEIQRFRRNHSRDHEQMLKDVRTTLRRFRGSHRLFGSIQFFRRAMNDGDRWQFTIGLQ